jgi:hypothetical protein
MVRYGRRIGGKLLSKRLPYLYLFLAAHAAFIFLHILYVDAGHPQYNLAGNPRPLFMPAVRV